VTQCDLLKYAKNTFLHMYSCAKIVKESRSRFKEAVKSCKSDSRHHSLLTHSIKELGMVNNRLMHQIMSG
jgi:hypothetical protein